MFSIGAGVIATLIGIVSALGAIQYGIELAAEWLAAAFTGAILGCYSSEFWFGHMKNVFSDKQQK